MVTIDPRLMELTRHDCSYGQKSVPLWGDEDRVELARSGLNTVITRGATLRQLILFFDDDLKKSLFSTLVELASVGHADVYLCRLAILSIPRAWVLTHIQAEVEKVLARTDDHEAYQRFAELFSQIDSVLLNTLLERARNHENPDIREIATGTQPN